MYEEFRVTDRWTGEELHCRWKANIVAIATRHADAVDVRFDVNTGTMAIALPCTAWVEQKKRGDGDYRSACGTDCGTVSEAVD